MKTSASNLTVAVLTPPGRGAVGTIRLDGPSAAETAAAHLSCKTAKALLGGPANGLCVGRFRATPGDVSGEEVVVRRLPCGAVDLHCHGGLAAVEFVVQALVAAGATRISWQEWAVQNESDAIASAALAAVAEAATPRTAAILVDQYRGALRQAFAEIESAQSSGQPASARQLAQTLLARAELGRHLTEPWRVALAGRPNVGKSTLMNALAGYRRAIVHSEPGTTRDVVTLRTAVEGWPIEFCDTAGLHNSIDPLERQGMEKARALLVEVDLIVLVFDRSTPSTEEDARLAADYPQALAVHSKCDLPAAGEQPIDGVALRAIDGGGMDELCREIAVRLVPNVPPPGAAVPFLPEHVAWLVSRMRQLPGGL